MSTMQKKHERVPQGADLSHTAELDQHISDIQSDHMLVMQYCLLNRQQTQNGGNQTYPSDAAKLESVISGISLGLVMAESSHACGPVSGHTHNMP